MKLLNLLLLNLFFATLAFGQAGTGPSGQRVQDFTQQQLLLGDFVSSGQQTVTQATNVTTGVTLNASKGVITTQSETAAADVSASFTFTNSYITASSVVIAVIENYAGTYGTNGVPQVNVNGVTAGSCTITVSNNHSANALSGALKIGFLVF